MDENGTEAPEVTIAGQLREIRRLLAENERLQKARDDQAEQASDAAHMIIDVVGWPTHADLDGCGCEQCERVRASLVSAGYLHAKESTP